MSNFYIVKPGETIGDVVLNSTGSFSNWDIILEANAFDNWTPEVISGQKILIPDTVNKDQNTLRQLSSYPACNISINDVLNKIAEVFDIIFNNWILETGNWNDKAIWIDSKSWID